MLSPAPRLVVEVPDSSHRHSVLEIPFQSVSQSVIGIPFQSVSQSVIGEASRGSPDTPISMKP